MAESQEFNLGKQRFFDDTAGGWEHGRRDDPAVLQLVSELPVAEGNTVVEPGCGTGLISELLASKVGRAGRLVAFDISPKMIELAKAKSLGPEAEFYLASTSRIPLDDAMADSVICVRVFPHIDNRREALDEFRRVLKPSGKMIIAHPAGRERLNTYHAKVGGEVAEDMIPDETGMRSLLGEAGFELIELVDYDERYLVIAQKNSTV